LTFLGILFNVKLRWTDT